LRVALFFHYLPESAVIRFAAWSDFHRLTRMLFRISMSAALQPYCGEEMMGIGMPRFSQQDAPVQTFRVLEPPGAMMFHRGR
jgi:hypothetical protein